MLWFGIRLNDSEMDDHFILGFYPEEQDNKKWQ
jgi:hypothetical protein